MARYGINYEQVAQAAAHLSDSGKVPTIERVRGLLGSGSSTTISKYLQQWKLGHTPAPPLVVNTPVTSLPIILQEKVTALWQQLSAQADDKIQQEIRIREDKLIEIEKSLEKYKHNNQRWQNLYTQWLAEKNQLKKAQEDTQAALVRAKEDTKQLETIVEKTAQQLLEKSDRIEELQQMLTLNQTHLSELTATFKTQIETQSARHESLTGQLKQEINELRSSEAAAIEAKSVIMIELDASLKANKRLQIEADTLNRNYAAVNDERNNIQAEYAKYKQLCDHWKNMHQELQALCMTSQAELLHKTDALQVAIKKIESQESQHNQLLEEKKHIEQTNWRLQLELEASQNMIKNEQSGQL